MAGKRKADIETVLGMHYAGKSREEIAEALGCQKSTVQKALADAGLTKYYKADSWKCPIHPTEIQRLKDQIKIGQPIWIEVQDMDEEFRVRKKDEKCRAVGKYPHLILAKNSKGTRRTITYAELAIRERQMGT